MSLLGPNAVFLTQPLTTEEGYVNEACLNELTEAIRNLPKYSENPDLERTLKGYTSLGDLTGEYAKWIIIQAKGAPNTLPHIINYIAAEAKQYFKSFTEYDDGQVLMWEISLNDIAKFHELIENEPIIAQLNEESFMAPQNLEWIDLGALERNVMTGVRNDRRHFAAFNFKFDYEWEKDHPPK